MPLYDYSCRQCGRSFDELVMNSSQKIVCPDCGSEDVEREISLFSSSRGGCSPFGGGFG